MNTKNYGGPAFPSVIPANTEHGAIKEAGMTLRDYFAAAALQGLSSLPDDRSYRGPEEGFGEWRKSLRQQDAEYCYQMADALLAHRAKEEV